MTPIILALITITVIFILYYFIKMHNESVGKENSKYVVGGWLNNKLLLSPVPGKENVFRLSAGGVNPGPNDYVDVVRNGDEYTMAFAEPFTIADIKGNARLTCDKFKFDRKKNELVWDVTKCVRPFIAKYVPGYAIKTIKGRVLRDGVIVEMQLPNSSSKGNDPSGEWLGGILSLKKIPTGYLFCNKKNKAETCVSVKDGIDELGNPIVKFGDISKEVMPNLPEKCSSLIYNKIDDSLEWKLSNCLKVESSAKTNASLKLYRNKLELFIDKQANMAMNELSGMGLGGLMTNLNDSQLNRPASITISNSVGSAQALNVIADSKVDSSLSEVVNDMPAIKK